MESETGIPAPYGRACSNCSRAKCKCLYMAEGGGCERSVDDPAPFCGLGGAVDGPSTHINMRWGPESQRSGERQGEEGFSRCFVLMVMASRGLVSLTATMAQMPPAEEDMPAVGCGPAAGY